MPPSNNNNKKTTSTSTKPKPKASGATLMGHVNDQNDGSTADKQRQKRNQPHVVQESPFANKKGKFVLPDSDDDDEESKAEPGTLNAHFVVINPVGNKLCGFIMYLDGWTDKVLGDIMCTPAKGNKHVRKFKEYVDLVQRVCAVLDDDGTEIANDRGFNVKGVVFLLKDDTGPVTEEMVKEWYNDVFAPAFKLIAEKEDHEVNDDQWCVPEGTISFREHWLSALKRGDFNHVFKKYQQNLIADKKKCFQFQNWIGKSKENLYSVYVPGTLSKMIMKSPGITDEMLHPDDLAKKTSNVSE